MPSFRLLDSLPPPAPTESVARRVESRPPVLHPWRDAWPGARFGASRRRSEALAAARFAFTEALSDIRTPSAIDAQGRIAIARTLHELWHLREEVFSAVARRHDQAEAGRRLATLNRHFPRRSAASPGPR